MWPFRGEMDLNRWVPTVKNAFTDVHFIKLEFCSSRACSWKMNWIRERARSNVQAFCKGSSKLAENELNSRACSPVLKTLCKRVRACSKKMNWIHECARQFKKHFVKECERARRKWTKFTSVLASSKKHFEKNAFKPKPNFLLKQETMFED